MVVPIRENITQYYNILIITNNTPLITAMNTLTRRLLKNTIITPPMESKIQEEILVHSMQKSSAGQIKFQTQRATSASQVIKDCCWLSFTSDSAAAIHFSKQFSKKAGSPECADPEVHSNIVSPPKDFVPGLNAECKQAVEEDRELGDKDSLTICGAGSDESVNIKSLELEAEEVKEPQMITAPSKDPFKQSGQCPVSWDAL